MGATCSWDFTVPCNHLQNAVAITYIFGLQLTTFIFYNKQSSVLNFEKKTGMTGCVIHRRIRLRTQSWIEYLMIHTRSTLKASIKPRISR